jgi:hypothetical protein
MKLHQQYQAKFFESGELRYTQHKNENLEYHQRLTLGGQFQLIIRPWRYMVKDFIDTFKPYKSKAQLNKDKWQFFNGLHSVFLGSLQVIVWPVISLIYFGVTVISPKIGLKPFLAKLILFPLEAASNLIRGVTQIVTAPLALLRIPFRALITAFTGTPLIENKAGIKSLVRQAQKNEGTHTTNYLINSTLAKKCIRAKEKGEVTNFPWLMEAITASKTNNTVMDYRWFLTPPVQKTPRSRRDLEVIVYREDSDNSVGGYSPTRV